MANDITTPFDMAEESRLRTEPGEGVEESTDIATYSDEELLEIWSDIKTECLNNRWMFERQWQRNLWYVLGRQWLEYLSRYGGWRDKRIAQWIPRPVTNKCKETVQAIRAMFTSIQLGVNVRPNGQKPENVSAAATADSLAPVLHERHHMNSVLNEFDFWLISCGNAFIHTFVDYDIKNGVITIEQETCQQCGNTYGSDELAGAQPQCPDCGGTSFASATDPETGEPAEPVTKMKGKPTTMVLSPLELAFPNAYPRFEELPYVVRMRWRTRRFIENHPVMSTLPGIDTMVWQKSPTDQSLQIFTNLSKYTDLGLSPTYSASTEGGAAADQDGIVEYEVWMKPTAKYPDGLVFRVLGDGPAPQIVHLEESEQLVARPVATRLSIGRRGLCQNLLLHGEVRLEIDLRGFHRLVPQPKSDNRPIDTRLQQPHGHRVPEDMRGHVFLPQRRARLAGERHVLGQQIGDSIRAEAPAAGIGE
jgi:ribosomal protein S27AE